MKRVMTIVFLPAILIAQTQTSGKREPESRKIELGNKSVANQSNRPLPKIDLPEFVITGIASIDLPDAEKLSLDAGLQERPRAMSELGNRDRATFELSGGLDQRSGEPVTSWMRGKAAAGIGSFFSPKASLWIGRTHSDVEYSLGADYFRTRGFAPFTDRSGGGFSLNGGMNLQSTLLQIDRAKINGSMDYHADAFKFYGSAAPQISRNLSRILLTSSLTSPFQLLWSYEATMSFHSNSITDSSSHVGESQIDLALQTLFPMPSVSVRFDLNASISSLSGSTSASLSYIDLVAGLDQVHWNNWLLLASVHVYGAGGMEGQSLSKVYPDVTLGYQLSQEQAIAIYYNPKVDFWNLSRHIARNTYVSSVSTLRHSDAHQAGGVSWQGYWSKTLRSAVSVEAKSILDFPMYADSASRGVWVLAYGGATTLIVYKGELFAKFSPIDYFGSALVVNSSENSLTGRGIPYMPEVEASASYTHDFPFEVSLSGDLTFFHSRIDNVIHASSSSGELLLDVRAEYRILSSLRTFMEVRNLTNARYELWKGYQAFPFTMAVGLTAVW